MRDQNSESLILHTFIKSEVWKELAWSTGSFRYVIFTLLFSMLLLKTFKVRGFTANSDNLLHYLTVLNSQKLSLNT